MNESTNDLTILDIKRSIILNTVLRFSPHIQTVKEESMDQLIENILYRSGPEKWKNETEILNDFTNASGGCSLNYDDFKKSVKRLVGSNKLKKKKSGDKSSYLLSKSRISELVSQKSIFESLIKRVVLELFEYAEGGLNKYLEPFNILLSNIFSRVGEESVRLIIGNIEKEYFLSNSTIVRILEEIKKQYPNIDHSLFTKAINKFFTEDYPSFGELKWNMAQNYYIVKALGLDHTGNLLSEELFKKATFYLDTNIIIDALSESNQNQNSIIDLCKTCQKIDINFNVSRITLEELQRWVDSKILTLKSVLKQIPEKTRPKVDSSFLKLYFDKQKAGKKFEIEDLFNEFKSPLENLNKHFEVSLIDDIWFDEAADDEDTKEFAFRLQEVSKRPYFYKTKNSNAATHDALVLRWISKNKSVTSDKILFLTADSTLQGIVPSDCEENTLSITKESLWQWMYSISLPMKGERGFTSAFAKLIKNRILPQSQFFKLEDFIIFNDMEMTCTDLPSKDVEDCIRYLKSEAPLLNPSNPSDREKMFHKVAQFLVSPDRVYKQEIASSEKRRREELIKYENIIDKLNKYIKEKDDKIDTLEKSSVDRDYRRKITRKSIIALLLIVIMNTASSFYANIVGTEDNWLLNIEAFPLFMSLVFTASIIIGKYILRRYKFKNLWGIIPQLFSQGKP